MTKKPPARLSRPRTGPAAPAPAHGDGPTRPSAPTGRTEPDDNEITVTITADTSGFESALKDARIATLELAVTELTRRAEKAERERDEALAAAERLDELLIAERSITREHQLRADHATAAVRRVREMAEAAKRESVEQQAAYVHARRVWYPTPPTEETP